MEFYAMPGLGGPRPLPDTRDPSVVSWEAAYDGLPTAEVPISHRGLPALGTE